MVCLLSQWAAVRQRLPAPARTAADLRLAGYFCFAMATYTLWPLLGVRTFALAPEKMIRYGRQSEAASFALHLLIELALGWLFIALSLRRPYWPQGQDAAPPAVARAGHGHQG